MDEQGAWRQLQDNLHCWCRSGDFVGGGKNKMEDSLLQAIRRHGRSYKCRLAWLRLGPTVRLGDESLLFWLSARFTKTCGMSAKAKSCKRHERSINITHLFQHSLSVCANCTCLRMKVVTQCQLFATLRSTFAKQADQIGLWIIFSCNLSSHNAQVWVKATRKVFLLDIQRDYWGTLNGTILEASIE